MASSNTDSNHQTPLAEINVTPLVDVMLVLLIIFIIVAPMFSQAIKINLPSASAPNSNEPVVLDVSLDDTGALFIDGVATDMSLLEDELKKRGENKPGLVVRIGADAKTSYENVTQLLSKIRATGISRIAFATQRPP